MKKSEAKFTINELIIMYMSEKVGQGYLTHVTREEFLGFFEVFKNNFKDFNFKFNRKNLFLDFMNEYSRFWNKDKPHFTFDLVSCDVLHATYNFSLMLNYTKNISVLTDIRKNQVKNFITKYLQANFTKRNVNPNNFVITDEYIATGKYIIAAIIKIIFENYIRELIIARKWPYQCKDINMFLFDLDLAKIIGVESIFDDIIRFYKDNYRKAAFILQKDINTQISNSKTKYYSYANFCLMLDGYMNLLDKYAVFEEIFISKSRNEFILKYTNGTKRKIGFDNPEILQIVSKLDKKEYPVCN